MELRHLRYFVAVAEEMHFGRAAEKLHLSQPPLSQQIQQLEREMSVSLFLRSNRRIALTAAGAAFLPEAKRILAQVDLAVLSAQQASQGEIGTLSIGFSTSATFEALPVLLSSFRAAYPEVSLSLYELNAAQQTQALTDHTIDLGLARPALTETHLWVETVVREPLIAALPEHHRLALKPAVTLADLALEPFILSPENPKPSYADSIKALCARAGFIPRVVQEAREMPTVLSLVAAGLGVSIVPASSRNLRRSGLIYRPLTDPDATTELTAAYRQDDTSPTLARFLEIMRRTEWPGVEYSSVSV